MPPVLLFRLLLFHLLLFHPLPHHPQVMPSHVSHASPMHIIITDDDHDLQQSIHACIVHPICKPQNEQLVAVEPMPVR